MLWMPRGAARALHGDAVGLAKPAAAQDPQAQQVGLSTQ